MPDTSQYFLFFIVTFNLFFTAVSLYEFCHLSTRRSIAQLSSRHAYFSSHTHTSINEDIKYAYLFHIRCVTLGKNQSIHSKKIHVIHPTYCVLLEKRIIIAIVTLFEVYTLVKFKANRNYGDSYPFSLKSGR
jgi:hypothetical protein